MVNNLDLMQNIKSHYLKTRYKLLPQESSLWSTYKAAGGVFETAKLLTMDKVFDQYYSFMTKVKLDNQDLKNKSFGLRTNILEATLTDTFKLNFSNAYAGKTLIANPIQNIYKDKNLIKQVFSDGWSPLYETWNLAFVTANLNNLHIILPKLLIPSVIGASDDEYLFYRGLSLWITINLYLFHKIEKKENIDLPDKIKNPIVKIWGEINKKHAIKMDKKPFYFILPYGFHLGWEALTSRIFLK